VIRITEFIIRFLLGKEEKTMDIVMATLIVKKKRFYKDLDSEMKARVKPLLIALEREDLIIEDATSKDI